METKACGKCHTEFILKEFLTTNGFRWDSVRNRWSSYCKECNKAYQREHYRKNKVSYIEKNLVRRKDRQYRLFDYLTVHHCVDCSESDKRVLQFDHIGEKTHNISDMIRDGHSWKSILAEIDLCEVVCANCHMKRTSETYGWFWESLNVESSSENEA